MLTEIAVQNSRLWNLFFSLLLKLGSADPINKVFLACVVLPLPNMSEASSRLRQDPLEAILVIFGRRALIFLFESSWKKMKNDATFVRMRSGDHLGDAKMSKKGTSLRRI